MPRRGISGQFMESFKSLGKSTVKSTAEALGSFSPLKIAQEILTPQTGGAETANQNTPEGVKKQNATPLNLNSLSEKYHKKDEQEAMKIQQRLFQMVNTDASGAINSRQRLEHNREQSAMDEHQSKMRDNAPSQELETVSTKTARGARQQKKVMEIKPSSSKH